MKHQTLKTNTLSLPVQYTEHRTTSLNEGKVPDSEDMLHFNGKNESRRIRRKKPISTDRYIYRIISTANENAVKSRTLTAYWVVIRLGIAAFCCMQRGSVQKKKKILLN